MPEEISEPLRTSQAPASGRALFRLIVQSLLRAGIKSIPLVGSGLDQAFWGTREAIAAVELRRLLETVLANLNDLRNAVENPSDEKLARIAHALAEQSEMQSIVLSLDQADTSTLRMLMRYLRELAHEPSILETAVPDFRQLTVSVESVTSSAVEDVKKARKDEQTESQTIHDQLSRLSYLLQQNRRLAQTELETIFSNLRALETKILCEFALAVTNAFEIPSDSELRLTIDFSELHRYAISPYSVDPIAAFSVYDLSASSSPFYILPGAAFELRAFLRKRLELFTDPATMRKKLQSRIKQLMQGKRNPYATAEDLAFLSDVTLNRHSPLQRLSTLFKKKLVVPWDQPLPSEHAIHDWLEVTYKVLSGLRPNLRHANMIDARNLAIVGSINATLKSNDLPITHISGAPALTRAVQKIEAGAPFRKNFIPIVIHPATLAFTYYLKRGAANFEKEKVVAAALLMRGLSRSVRTWAENIRALDLQKLGILASEVRTVVEALETFDTAVSPFRQSLLDCEVADLIGVADAKGTTLWGAKFEEVQVNVLETIIDLLSYLEPLEQSMAPFLEFSEKFPTRTNRVEPKLLPDGLGTG